MTPDGSKVCGRCKEQKPRAEFARAGTAPDGLQAWCRACKYAWMTDTGEPMRVQELAVVAPLTWPYEAVCMLCGDSKGLRLAAEEYRALRPMRCARCGGRMFVERGLVTSTHTGPAPSRHNNTVHYPVRTGLSA